MRKIFNLDQCGQDSRGRTWWDENSCAEREEGSFVPSLTLGFSGQSLHNLVEDIFNSYFVFCFYLGFRPAKLVLNVHMEGLTEIQTLLLIRKNELTLEDF